MTQVLSARAGQVTPEMKAVARYEGLSAELVAERVARGVVVIPANSKRRGVKVCGIGEGLKTKVNANVGTSPVAGDPYQEVVEKAKCAIQAGADTVMDLSAGGDLDTCRRLLLDEAKVPVGTVPVYQAMLWARENYGSPVKMSVEDLFRVIELHMADGVDFITVHCGLTQQVLSTLKKKKRYAGLVSRGGSLTAAWMVYQDRENPLYEQYDRLLDMCLRYDVTLSLGDGVRPGCLEDATDPGQVAELMVISELVDRAREAGVQVMVEGPGHVALPEVAAQVWLEKKLCRGAPFYVLGPLVTDVAAGYDHIAAAIGGAVASASGADFLCVVTPSEHLGLPSSEHVVEGVVAARIAAHAGDISKRVPGSREWDNEMSRARRGLDWEKQLELSIFPPRAREVRAKLNPAPGGTCSMCGDLCALEIVNQYLGGQVLECLS